MRIVAFRWPMRWSEMRGRFKSHALAFLVVYGSAVAPFTASAQAASGDAAPSKPSVSGEATKDAQLMEAERQLLQSLSSRTFSESAQKAAEGEPKAAEKPVNQKVVPVKSEVGTEPNVQPAKAVKEAPPLEPRDVPAAAVVKAKASAPPAVVAPSPPQDKPRPAPGVSNQQYQTAQNELGAARRKIADLERELDQTRSQLSMAETEVNRLSAIVDQKTRASLGRLNVPVPQPRRGPAPTQQVRPGGSQDSLGAAVSDVRPPASNADLQIATVSVDKADLRLGPGKNNSAIMSVPRGSRLVVEARQGEWYRVFAPNGERAWISASLVTFGDGAATLNDGSTVRVKGFNSNLEDEAFQRVQKITAGQ